MKGESSATIKEQLTTLIDLTMKHIKHVLYWPEREREKTKEEVYWFKYRECDKESPHILLLLYSLYEFF